MGKIRFPEEYIRRENCELHGGQMSNVFYDVNELLTNDFYVRHVIHQIPESDHYVGIATGGAIIAGTVWFERMCISKLSMVKDGELKGKIPGGKYLLIDDVTTTEDSLREAIGIIGHEPQEIIVCIDRRLEDKTLEISSIFEI